MANADVPRGFRPVRTLDQSPLSGKLQVFDIGASEGVMAIGDAVEISSGAIGRAESNDSILGVVVAFGNSGSVEFGDADGFDPERLDSPQVSQASTAGQTALVCLANGVVFSCQTDDGSTTDPVVGTAYDIVPGTVTASSTISSMEIDTQTTTNGDFQIVEVPYFNSANGTTNSGINDTGAVNAEVFGIFTDVVFGQS